MRRHVIHSGRYLRADTRRVESIRSEAVQLHEGDHQVRNGLHGPLELGSQQYGLFEDLLRVHRAIRLAVPLEPRRRRSFEEHRAAVSGGGVPLDISKDQRSTPASISTRSGSRLLIEISKKGPQRDQWGPSIFEFGRSVVGQT
jgi:hypothetical protein